MQPEPQIEPVYLSETTPLLNAHIVRWADTQARKTKLSEAWAASMGELPPISVAQGRDPKAAKIAGHFLEQETIEARRLAAYIAQKDGWLVDKAHPIPVIYSPDGALHTAHGFQQGVDWFTQGAVTLHAVEKPDYGVMERALPDIPEDVARAVLATRRVILCDSTVHFGEAIYRFQRQLTQLVEKEGGPPIDIIAIANNALGVSFPATDAEGKTETRSRIANEFVINKSAYSTAAQAEAVETKRHYRIEYLFTDIGRGTTPFDRGDALGYVDHPLASKWRSHLIRRIPEPASHQAILDEAKEANRVLER